MPQIHNKENKAANIEAVDLVNVDLTSVDYPSRSDLEHFGLILPEAATMRIETLGGSIGEFPLPAGYNPIACVKVYKTGSGITNFVAYY